MDRPAQSTAFANGDNLPSSSSAVGHLRLLSSLLDSRFSIPGTALKFGLDGIIGLIPGGGDLIGSLLSAYIVFGAAKAGAPLHVLLRMVGNIGVDTLVGVVPVVGDLADFVWKANDRNIVLLDRHLARQSRTERTNREVSKIVLGILLASILGIVVLGMIVTYFIIRAFAAILSF